MCNYMNSSSQWVMHSTLTCMMQQPCERDKVQAFMTNSKERNFLCDCYACQKLCSGALSYYMPRIRIAGAYPGFLNRGGAKDYVHAPHITSRRFDVRYGPYQRVFGSLNLKHYDTKLEEKKIADQI